MSPDEQHFMLVVERFGGWHQNRYCRRLVPERFQGLRDIEDLPMYSWIKRLLRGPRIRAKVIRERPMSRPDDLDVRLEECTPQFFLRNIARVERSVEDRPELQIVRTRDRQAETFECHRIRYAPPQFLEHWNIEDVLWLRALIRRYVFEEDWSRHFCRELKESVQGPLYRYNPTITE